MTIESLHRHFADQLFPAISMDGESNASGTSGRRKRIGLFRDDQARLRNNGYESSDEDVGDVTRLHMRGEIGGISPGDSISKSLKRQWNRAEESDADERVRTPRKKQRLPEVGSYPDGNLGIFPKKKRRKTEEGNNVESFSVSLRKRERKIEDENAPEESMTSRLDIRSRRLEEESRADEVTSLSLKRQRRRIDEENDPDESSSISMKKRRKKVEDKVGLEDFICSPLKTDRKYRVGTSPDDRHSESSMFNGEDDNPSASSNDSLNKLKGKKGTRNVEVEELNDSFKDAQEALVKIEEDDVQSGDKELDTLARAGNESAFEDRGLVPVNSEEEEGIPNVGFQKLKKKKKKKKVVEYDVDMTSADGVWASSLEGPHLDLMVSLKQLAEVRLKSSGEKSLANCLTPTALRAIGIILEELLKDRVATELSALRTKS